MGPNQFWMDSRVETDVYFIVRQGYIRICVGYPSPYEFIRPSSIYLLGGGAFGRAPKGSIYLLASQISQKKGDGGLNSRAFVPHPIRSRERECIYYICYYAMNDRSISSPQFKRLVLPSLSGYRLVLRRSRRTKANGKAGPKLRGWVERSANC